MAGSSPEDVVHWMCFSTDAYQDPYANAMAGRKLHALMAQENADYADINDRNDSDIFRTGRVRSVCGRLPRRGWTDDLFNDKKCARCLKRLGLHCPACGGTGVLDMTGCRECLGTGEREDYDRIQKNKKCIERELGVDT